MKRIKQGIAKGNPTLLTYDSNKSSARRRRRHLSKAAGGLIGASDINVDEYPYATTKEGGSNAAINLVPASENKSHGGYIGSLIRINKMKTGDKFNIILIEDKSDKKTPQYQPIPVCSPSTNKTPSFMEKMQQVTGLTGALLITYIIISEGSRVVFPPRNLVPIP